MNIYLEFRMVDGGTYVLHVCQKHYDDDSYYEWLYDKFKEEELDEWVQYTEPCFSNCDICNLKANKEKDHDTNTDSHP